MADAKRCHHGHDAPLAEQADPGRQVLERLADTVLLVQAERGSS